MRSVEVKLERAAIDTRNLPLLAKALEALGFIAVVSGSVIRFSGVHKETGQFHTGSISSGEIQFSGTLEVNSIKRAYAAEVIKKNFGQMGKVTKTGDGKYTVTLKAHQ